MFHCLSNVIETKKTAKKFHLTWVTVGGGGGQDGKWSHFPPFFNPSLSIIMHPSFLKSYCQPPTVKSTNEKNKWYMVATIDPRMQLESLLT